jgi:uncharacterized protein with ParB-like and HNH nuclease domain
MSNIVKKNVMSNNNGESKPIKEIFSGSNFYKVPEYQRPFFWKKDNFEQLIDDLIREYTENPKDSYFLGTAVFHINEDENINYIVDGQQRITTLIILFACLRDSIGDESFKSQLQDKIMQKENLVDGIPQKERIEVREENIFTETILTVGGTLKELDYKQLKEPEKRYIDAINIFRDRIEKIAQPELIKLTQYINQQAVMIVLHANTFNHAFRLFTIVNDRGRQLRRIDVLKAKNLSFILEDSKRKGIADDWENWETDLGEDTFEGLLYLIRFIYLEEKPYTDLLEEYEKKILGGAKPKIKWGVDFFKSVFKYAELYSKIFEDGDYFEHNKNAKKINSLLHIMKSEFKSNDWRACLMQYIDRFGDENIEDFLYKLELKFLEGVIAGLSKDARTTAFGQIMNDINTAKSTKEVLQSKSLDSDAELMRCELKKDLYGRSFSKYILLRLELLSVEDDTEHKFIAKSIEHVLPQTITGTQWEDWFTEQQKSEWVNKLANLVILSKSKNSSAKNLSFEEKKVKYLKPKVTGFPCSVQVTSYAEWKMSDLENRQKELLEKVLKNVF